MFRVSASTNIDWSAIQWHPHVYYVSSNDSRYVITTTGGSPSPLIDFYPIPEYTLYTDMKKISTSWTATDTTVTVTPHLEFINQFARGKVIFSVKKLNELLYKDTLTVIDGVVSNATDTTLRVKKGDKLYVEYHISDGEHLATLVSKSTAGIAINGGTETSIEAGLYTIYYREEDAIFGSLYRSWGQFAYNGNREKADAAIDERLLKLSDQMKNSPAPDAIKNPDDLNSQGAYNPATEQFIVLGPMGKEKIWQGYDAQTFVNATVISSSRLGNDDLTVASVVPGGGARGINKISKSKSSSFTAGASVVVASAGYNTSSGTTDLLADFIDMNGDRYPDIVTDNRIQYSTANGGLEENYVSHSMGPVHETTTSSDGFSAGAFVSSTVKGGRNTKTSVGSAKVSASINGSFGKGTNDAAFSWMDINGDGLPDKVYAGGNVALNLGYSFAQVESWGHTDISKGNSKSKSAGLSVSVGNGSQSASFSAGVGLALSENYMTGIMEDVNGDGLIDEVQSSDGAVQVKLNTGNGFSSTVLDWTGASQLNRNSSSSQSANASFTGCFPVWLIRICLNPNVNIGNGVSRDLKKLTDMDGDGYPDYVTSDADNNLRVSRSSIGRTNLLKGVTRPLGAMFSMSYKRIGNSYAMPENIWALDSVKVFDGFKGDGVDNTLTTYNYEGGFYDRYEREFNGFSKVITNSHDTEKGNKPVYTVTTQTFVNDNYYEKGLLVNEIVTNANNNKYSETTNTYQLKDIATGANLPESVKKNLSPGNAFPALVKTEQKFYEGQAEAGKTTSMTYGYDAIGNIISYTDFGDEGDEDDISSSISYHSIPDKYIMGAPQQITVKSSGTTIRKRQSVIDPQTGDVTQIKQYLSDSEIAIHSMEYDQYGNLSKITRPTNAKDQRLSINYVYDNSINTYAIKISNSYGYTSETTYDFRFGQLLTSKDINGNLITYTIDDLGRVVNIVGPYEKATGNAYTIKFEYHPEATIPWALTSHYDPSDPKNDLQTAIFIDGLGRVLQTKKDVAIYAGDGKADVEMMAVSGRVTYDAFGRGVRALYPITETKGTPGVFNTTEDNVKPALTTYDVLGRVLTVTLPDQAVTQTVYGFESDRNNQKQFSTKTTDANGKQTEQFSDVRGRVTSVKNYTSEKPIWISFKYNAINEQIESIDDQGNITISTYDNLGRRVSRKHPDTGITTYNYDLAGNLKEVITANLQKVGQSVNYVYDFERLMSINYPENPENNVKFTYGEIGATDNRTGRIVLQEDATGAQEFFYGPLGEVVKNIRTIVLPKFTEQTFTTEYQYDTWNRLTSMTYADGEAVTYTYNSGGLLRSMSGKKKGATFNYVNQLGYDKFEQRVFLAYGNGTKTTYTYEADRRRLKNMTAQTTAKRLFMDNTYTYDKVDNILALKNNAVIPSSNLMGGSSDYTYEYDDLYRLTKAQGSFKGANSLDSYTLKMEYNSVGGITEKVQNHLSKGQTQKKTSYTQNYTYSSDQPHSPTHIGERTFTYDANGNQTGWKDDKTGQDRRLMWDEENRIRSIYDNGSQHHYVYDASGIRVIKGKSIGERIFVNGEWKAGSGSMGNYTVYVNPYLVLRSGGYTKHYYIEGQRIVSKIGAGWDNTAKSTQNAGGNKIDYITKSQKLFDGIVKNLKFLGSDGQILTAGNSGKTPPGQLKNGGSTAEKFQYFYHSDHLGSTSYITDASGEVYQHLEYFAFGETFVDEHNNTDRVPYLFNGKELDEETELYYYGARYYDPKTSMFLTIDPLAEKYPNINPYAYAFNNPLHYSDPTGMEGEDEVAPAGHKKHSGANGKALYLPTGAQTETFQKTGQTSLANNSGVQTNATGGSVRAFTIGKARYVAAYNGKSGDFIGYKNFKTGEMYNNPSGLKTSGTIAKVGFGETRGLYPSSDGGKVGTDPANWDYAASQQLMEARAAIEVVRQRNTKTHPGAEPSNNPNNAEYNQRPFAISENFPSVDPAISNDPEVTQFYNASSATFVPGGKFYDSKSWNISLVKSYGPFYNASSKGDTKKGGSIYINFYKLTSK
ncbi:MAG TPA: RHS repeat-associated core domain-containing protein [Cyclobacteriaceae bacterium]|nr:RHS repeat-associated core domain-containing protein [Cyclobacteriaceae bacterium]